MRAPKILKARVTERHLEEGTPGRPRACALALAIREEYGDEPAVYGDELYVTFEDGLAAYDGTARSLRFTDMYDHEETRGRCRPGTFQFRLRWVRDGEEMSDHDA